jgi:ADP-ribosylation factor-binding protein GGA
MAMMKEQVKAPAEPPAATLPPQPKSSISQTPSAPGGAARQGARPGMPIQVLNDQNKAPSEAVDQKPPSGQSVEATSRLNDNSTPEKPQAQPEATPAEVKLGDLEVPLSSIVPGNLPPVSLTEAEESSGISIVLNFGRDRPRENVSAVVATALNKTPRPISRFDLRVLAPKSGGVRVKLQAPSGTDLPAFSPFAPPASVTQVILVASPAPAGAGVRGLKYVLSYEQDGEPLTEMGTIPDLPL